MKIISIGDIHGRTFWKRIDPAKYDKIIFIGDYVDSFPYDDAHILNNLMDIIEFKKSYPNKVEILIGNHDIQYMYLSDGFGCSGFRPSMASSLNSLFMENKKLFKMAFQIGEYIWSHAGIAVKWLEYNEKEIKAFKKKFDCVDYADTFNKMMFTHTNRILHQVGTKRGGYYPAGGITWADRNETSLNPLEGYHQIVGHTAIDSITKFGDDKGSVRYIDCLHKLEFFKNEEDFVNSTIWFHEFEIDDLDVEKYEIWKEDYNYIEWNKFKNNWFRCDRCNSYAESSCICYAR